MTLTEIRALFGPHKKYPFYFLDHPEANALLDAIPKLLDVADVAHAFIEHFDVVFRMKSRIGDGPWKEHEPQDALTPLREALAALEAAS